MIINKKQIFFMQKSSPLQKVLSELLRNIQSMQLKELLQVCRSSITLFLARILDFELNTNGKALVIKIVDSIMQSIINQQDMDIPIDIRFRVGWFIAKIAQKNLMDEKQMTRLFRSAADFQFANLKTDFIESLVSLWQSDQQKNQMRKLCKQIEKNENYNVLKFRYPTIRQKQYQADRKTLDTLRQIAMITKNSIIDELFATNQLKAFESQFCIKYKQPVNNSDVYTNQDYIKFISALRDICQKNGINRYDLKEGDKQIQSFYNKIVYLRNKVHPVFIPQFIANVRKNASITKNKDVVAIVGDSGSGKTTIIQILLGYKLFSCKNSSGLATLAPLNRLKKEHQELIAQASSKSVTKRAVVVKLDLPQNFADIGEVHILDTTGFNDSNGILADVTNSFNTIKVLIEANSIRVAFVINETSWVERGAGFKGLARQAAKLLQKVDQNKIIYLLNRFESQQALVELIARAKNLQQQGLNNEDKGNHKMVAIVKNFNERMQKIANQMKKHNISAFKAFSESDQLILVSPLNFKLNKTLYKILAQQKKIINPSQALNISLSEEALKYIKFQIELIQKFIRYYIGQNKLEAANYYISQLKQVKQITQRPHEDVFGAEARIQSVINMIREMYTQIKHKLEKFQKNMANLKATQQQIVESKSKIQYLAKLQTQLKNLPEISSFQDQYSIKGKIEQILSSLKTKFNNNQLSRQLLKCAIPFYQSFYPEFKVEIQNFLEARAQQLRDKMVHSIEQEQYCQFDRLVSQKKYFCTLSLGIFDLSNLFTQQECAEILKEKLQARKQMFIKMVGKQKNLQSEFGQNEVIFINKTFQIFDVAESANKQVRNIYNQYFIEAKKFILNVAQQQLLPEVKNICKLNAYVSNLNRANILKSISYKFLLIKSIKEEMLQILDSLSSQIYFQMVKNYEKQIEIEKTQNIKGRLQNIVNFRLYALFLNKGHSQKIKLLINQNKQKLFSQIRAYFERQIKLISWRSSRFMATCEITCKILQSFHYFKNQFDGFLDQMSQIVKEKISMLIQSGKQLIKSLKNDCQNLDKIQSRRNITISFNSMVKMIGTHLQVRRLNNMDVFNVLKMHTEISQALFHIQQSAQIILAKLQEVVLQNLQKVKSIIDDIGPQVQSPEISRGNVRMIVQILRIIQKINGCKEYQDLIEKDTEQFEGKYRIFVQQISNSFQNQFQKFIQQNSCFQMVSWFKKNCIAISELKDYQCIFTSTLENIQSNIQIHKRKINVNSDYYMDKNGTIDICSLKQLYNNIKLFKEEKVKNNLLQKLKAQVQHDQRQLVKSKFINRKTTIYKILDLQDKVMEINSVIQQQNAISISPQTAKFIDRQCAQILKGMQNKIKDMMSRQKQFQCQQLIQDYNTALQILQNIQIQNVQNLVKSKRQALGDLQIQDYFKQLVRTMKEKKMMVDQRSSEADKLQPIDIKIQPLIIQQKQQQNQQKCKKIVEKAQKKEGQNNQNQAVKQKQKFRNYQTKQDKESIIRKQPTQYQQVSSQKIIQTNTLEKLQQKRSGYKIQEVAESQNSQDKYFQKTIQNYNKQIRSKVQVDQICRISVILSPVPSMKEHFKIISNNLVSALKKGQKQLQSKGVKSQFQLCMIRNYNGTFEQLYSQTEFYNDPGQFQRCLNSKNLKLKGGWGKLAFQVAFQRLRTSRMVDKVIIIAGSGGNNQTEAQDKWKFFTKHYYDIPFTSPSSELALLKKASIPIFSLFTSDNQYFDKISSQTGGRANFWNYGADNSGQQLNQIICNAIIS